MSLAIVYSRANLGIEAPLVTVEAHLSNGLPGFSIVGLPETAVKESKERVRSAILNSQLDFPARRITLNLAPADLPKSGGRFDLAIAIGILAASDQIDSDKLNKLVFMGELALSGEVRQVSGLLPGIIASHKAGSCCIVPKENEAEAALPAKAQVKLCGHLLDVCSYLKGESELAKPVSKPQKEIHWPHDLQDVVGQQLAKRALIIAAAGGHNLLMRGPPGTGKTMLASRLNTILPPLSQEQALEVAAIKSIARQHFTQTDWHRPPFRAPHHTSSAVALVGGGSTLNTGEITLAHRGVLFLDELPEFSPKVLEVMREPLEAGSIQISRAKYQVRLPASFQLIAAMNPCPCGYYGDPERECRCSMERVKQYQQRVSGPLLDRIDLQVTVSRLSDEEKSGLLKQPVSTLGSSQHLREQVNACRKIQLARAGKINAHLDQAEIKKFCNLSTENEEMLGEAMKRLRLSTRAYFRILKIARTLADLSTDTAIHKKHLLEAINYRRFDSQL